MSQASAKYSGIRCDWIFISAACGRETYQNLHLKIRKTEDTAEVAKLKKEAYDEFKERKNLTLKEFTALNTAAKSQEARLANKVTAPARKTLDEIGTASAGRLRYLKYFLYNDQTIQALTRQEKQRLWDAIRARETALQTAIGKPATQPAKAIQQPHFQRGQQTQKQVVRVTPRSRLIESKNKKDAAGKRVEGEGRFAFHSTRRKRKWAVSRNTPIADSAQKQIRRKHE